MRKKKEKIIWNGFEQFRQFLVPLDKLKENPENTRKHSDRNIIIMKTSLNDMGQHRLGVTLNDGILQIGNGMLRAAQELGWTHLAVIKSGDEGAIARLRAIVDNRAGEVGSDWDFPHLDMYLECLVPDFDMASFGFDTKDIELLFGKGDDDVPPDSTILSPYTGKPIKVTADQRTVIDQAIAKVREESEDKTIKEGRCIELISADFIAGSPSNTTEDE